MFKVIKTYGHERGLSCAFRQWRAASHCSLIHGYAIAVELTFASEQLDERNWVIDFGSLKPVKTWLEFMFDHTVLLAFDDPLVEVFMKLNEAGAMRVITLSNGVGCERFAEVTAEFVSNWLDKHEDFVQRRVVLESVKIMEHGANAAMWQRKQVPTLFLGGAVE